VSVCDLFSFDVLLRCSHKDTNTVFRLVNPVYLMNPVNGMEVYVFKVHVFTAGLYTKGIRVLTQKELIRGGGLRERARVRRHYGPLCSTLAAANSGSICIAVVLVSVSGGVIVLSSERLIAKQALWLCF